MIWCIYIYGRVWKWGIPPPNRGPLDVQTQRSIFQSGTNLSELIAPADPAWHNHHSGRPLDLPKNAKQKPIPRAARPAPRGAILSMCSENIWSKDSAKIGSENHQDVDFDVVCLLVRIWELTQPATIVNGIKWRCTLGRFLNSAWHRKIDRHTKRILRGGLRT